MTKKLHKYLAAYLFIIHSFAISITYYRIPGDIRDYQKVSTVSLLVQDADLIGSCFNTHKNNPVLIKLLALFRNNIGLLPGLEGSYRIPPIIHQIWVGPKPLPSNFYELQQTWFENHPGWLYKLWTDADLSDFELENKKYFDESTNYAEKADILRYELLNRYGGVYVDVDVKCIKPFDRLHKAYDFYCGMHPITTVWNFVLVNNALIGSIPGHPILRACIDTIPKKWDGNYINDVVKVVERTGPKLFTESFMTAVDNHLDGIIALPPHYFYSIGNKKELMISEDTAKVIKEEVFALHYWAASWIPK